MAWIGTDLVVTKNLWQVPKIGYLSPTLIKLLRLGGMSSFFYRKKMQSQSLGSNSYPG